MHRTENLRPAGVPPLTAGVGSRNYGPATAVCLVVNGINLFGGSQLPWQSAYTKTSIE